MPIRQFRYAAYPHVESVPVIDTQLMRAHRYYNDLVAIERLKEEAWQTADTPEKKEALKLAHNARMRDARSHSGLYWGTYQAVAERVRAAVAMTGRNNARKRHHPNPEKRAPDPVAFHTWDLTGSLAVHYQPAITIVEDLTGPCRFDAIKARREKANGTDITRTITLRVGEAGETAKIDIRLDRPLPLGAKLSWVRLKCERRATRRYWFLTFVCEEPDVPVVAPDHGMIAIDVGWRLLSDGSIRVAAWIDDAEETGIVALPAALMHAWQKASDIESIRKTRFNEALDVVKSAREFWPENLRQETASVHLWKSQERLAAFTLRHRGEPHALLGDPGPGRGHDREWPLADDPCYLDIWRQRDKHLYNYGAGLKRQVQERRKAIYADFATAAAKYRTIVVEKLDLRDFAEHPDLEGGEEDEAPAIKASRERRFVAGLSYLLNGIAASCDKSGAFMSEWPPQDTTRTCHWCGRLNDPEARLVVRCACGRSWDVDDNARRNLLRAARQCADPLTRSKRQKTGKEVVSKIGAQRAAYVVKRKSKVLDTRDETAQDDVVFRT